MFIIASLSPLWAHQPVQRATFCAPQDCVWRRVDAVMAWTTAMMRVMRFSAVSYYLKEQQILHKDYFVLRKNVACLHSEAPKKLCWKQSCASFVCM